MNRIGTDLVLVVLSASPGLEDAVVDWLLGRRGKTGFTTTTIYGHSSRHEGLSIAEQVSGRRLRTQFEVHMTLEAARDFVRDAVDNFGAADIHCLVLPAIAAGSLSAVLDSLN